MNRRRLAQRLLELAKEVSGVSRTAARQYYLKKDTRTKKGADFKKGDTVHIFEYRDKYPYLVRLRDDKGQTLAVLPEAAYRLLDGFPKPPSLSTMERWMDRGAAKAIDGERVEPDGFSRNGAPSWLLVMGLI